jgi:hypothetical protein
VLLVFAKHNRSVGHVHRASVNGSTVAHLAQNAIFLTFFQWVQSCTLTISNSAN